jgi:tetratricopeptide (TPR) repeat protein
MFTSLLDSFSTIISPYLKHLGDTAELIKALIGIVTTAITVYVWLRRKIRRADVTIARLQDDLRRRDEQHDQNLNRIAELEQLQSDVGRRLPSAVLNRIEHEYSQGNVRPAHHLAAAWLEQEGEALSRLLRFEAEWATIHAVGDAHVSGLVVAGAYANAANAIWPYSHEVRELADELQRFCADAHLGSLPPFHVALGNLHQAEGVAQLDGSAVDRALELEQSALALDDRSSRRLALIQIERAIATLKTQLGAEAPATLRARMLRVRLLSWAGLAHVSLPDIQAITAVYARALGPLHPSTLASRYLLAHVLDTLGRSVEALPIIEDVAKQQEASPEFGADHPSTLASRYLLAQILNKLGRAAEALPIVEDVAKREQAIAGLGADHPTALTSRYLLAQILYSLGRSAEALPIIEDIAKRREGSPEFGTDHPSTLASRYLLAQVLGSLGRATEALSIIKDVTERQETSPEFGADHPHTLAGRYLLAQMLDVLGRSVEALPIIQDVAKRQEASPELGPDHPSTLAGRHLLAHVLDKLGRSAEKLPIAQDAMLRTEAHPVLGAEHPFR